jgi:hypothetical protein
VKLVVSLVTNVRPNKLLLRSFTSRDCLCRCMLRSNSLTHFPAMSGLFSPKYAVFRCPHTHVLRNYQISPLWLPLGNFSGYDPVTRRQKFCHPRTLTVDFPNSHPGPPEGERRTVFILGGVAENWNSEIVAWFGLSAQEISRNDSPTI